MCVCVSFFVVYKQFGVCKLTFLIGKTVEVEMVWFEMRCEIPPVQSAATVGLR